MNPKQPFRFSAAEKLVLLASAIAGVGVTWAVVRPGGALTAALILLAAFTSAAAGVALHLRERRRVQRSVASLKVAEARPVAEPGWSDLARAA